MAEKAYIVEAVRTAGGKRDGRLSLWHPADLGAKVLDEIVSRLDMDPELVDDVIFGCVDQVGAQSGNVARNAILSSSLPESVPGTSVDRQCGSSQQAIHFAIQAVMSGTQDVVVGGGGGASVLVPFVAEQLQLQYEKADYAEVISSIGVASSMMQEQLEETVVNPNPEQISKLHKKIHDILIEKGSTPESISVDSVYIPEKSLLRVTAFGNVELDNGLTAKNIFSKDEAMERALEISDIPKDKINLAFETDHYFVFTGNITTKKLMMKKSKQPIIIIDKYGREKLSLTNAKLIKGGISELESGLNKTLSSDYEISPQVYLLNELKLMDFSGLTSKSHIIDAIKKELEDFSNACVIVESKK